MKTLDLLRKISCMQCRESIKYIKSMYLRCIKSSFFSFILLLKAKEMTPNTKKNEKVISNKEGKQSMLYNYYKKQQESYNRDYFEIFTEKMDFFKK